MTTEIYVGDFETTVYEEQTFTEVWASAIVKLNTEDVLILHSIEETYNYLKSLKKSVIIYYHNLKFDGSFWIDFLERKPEIKQAYKITGQEPFSCEWLPKKYMANNSYKYSISMMGQWYSITIKVNNCFIEIRDSLKLLPFSVKQLGNQFGTKHHKLEMEYKGFRYSGCQITEDEKKYIANDVLVVKESLEIMFENGNNKLTIGSCCLSEFKALTGREEFKTLFPNLQAIELNKSIFGSNNVDEYIRKSYKGGWCYLVKGKENKIFTNGTTADVNSLYPSVMSSESENKYPTGIPKFWTGNFIPNDVLKPNIYFFIRIKTRFYLKKNKLPFIQIKNNFIYKSNEMLESSDLISDDGTHYTEYKDINNKTLSTAQTMTLTMTDYFLLIEHYTLVDFEILDGCYFYAISGIFDEYIEKYKEMKINSKGAKRTLAKLFLNNLYGKMATSCDSSFKIAHINEKNVVSFIPVIEKNKTPIFIACGSAITSYARDFTIRTAQKNFSGADKKGFIYADTDSIHCDLQPDELKGIKVHDTNFCCWKLESSWEQAIFVRQKTYIEIVTKEDLKILDVPYYNVKCAGMPEQSKKEFINSIMSNERYLTDFKIGLKLTGKLTPKRIKGGILLKESTYEMR